MNSYRVNEITKFQEIKILYALIRYADKEGIIDFKTTDIANSLSKIEKGNGFFVSNLLYDLDEAGIIEYTEVGEDGFEPIIFASINERTHIYLSELIEFTEKESLSIENRITEILTFNPKSLTQQIKDTGLKIDEVNSYISGTDLLKPLEIPLKEIHKHFESIRKVSEEYENIYKNIIKPVQEESRAGVKATVNWAIISIIISTAISLVISNFEKL
jgi:hypothetical protein